MSTGRRGRGGFERGGRGASSFNRGGGSRDSSVASRASSGSDTTTSTSSSRGQRGDRGNRGNTFRGNGSNRGAERGGKNTWRGRGGHSNSTTTTSTASAGNFNSTPHPQDDYASRLEWLRKERPRQKERFIREGRMNPEGPMRLSEAVKLYGACQDMCPEFERVRRIIENDLKTPEMTAESLLSNDRHARVPDEHRMVKAYQRSAAGMDVELISDIRPPSVCLKTLKYMIERTDNEELGFLYQWLWDRTRAVRKDLRTQAVEKYEDILIYLTCFEQCARLLLVCLHHMSNSNNEDYSHQQDVEQLNQTHISLKERYADNRRAGLISPNEAEFHAYRLILCLHTGDDMVEHEIHSLPQPLLLNRRIQIAVKILRVGKAIFDKDQRRRLSIAQQNWSEFWRLIASPAVSYLMACAAEVVFNRVRHFVLDTIWRAYRQGNAKQVIQQEDWTPSVLVSMLGMDDISGAKDFCESYGFSFKVNAAGEEYLDTHSVPWTGLPLQQPATLKPQIFSRKLVESKRYNRLLSAVIKGMSVREAKTNGFIVESLDLEEQSLFVSDGSATKQAGFGVDSGFSTPLSGAAGNNPFKPNPLANNFQPKAPTAGTNPFQASPSSNPFGLPSTTTSSPFAKQTPSTNGFGMPSETASNPFAIATLSTNGFNITASTSSPFSASTVTSQTVQPGLFDPAKDTIKFNAPSAPSGPLDQLLGPSRFPSKSKEQTPNEAPTSSVASSSPGFSGFVSSSSPQASLPSFKFAAPSSNNAAPESPKPFSSTVGTMPQTIFTSPTLTAPAEPTLEEQQREAKIREEQERQKKEIEAQNRIREEQARIEQQRQEQLAREAMQRAAIEEQKRRQEEEERKQVARAIEKQRALQERNQAYDVLARNVFLEETEGLLRQFIESQVDRMLPEVQADLAQERRENLVKELEKRKREVLSRRVLSTWYHKLFKKKRNDRARSRRQWLKENAAKLLDAQENGSSTNVTPIEQSKRTEMTRRSESITGFRRPAVPASAKVPISQSTAKQRSRRRDVLAVSNSRAQLNGTSEPLPQDCCSSTTSSNVVQKQRKLTTIPIDRSESDWFKLRAEGRDPSQHRKRSHDFETKEDDDQETDRKRARTSVSSVSQLDNTFPLPMTTEELLARSRAVMGALDKSSASAHSRRESISLRNGHIDNSSRIIAQARALLSANTSPANSPPDMHHEFSRSVPDLSLSLRQSGARTSFGQYSVKPAPPGKPAYWGRVSRFVPQHLYGKGVGAVRDYFGQSRGSSQADSAEPTGPLDLSSPIPAQQSYIRGYEDEEYDEDDEAEGEDNDEDDDAGEDEDEEVEDSEVEYGDEQYGQPYQDLGEYGGQEEGLYEEEELLDYEDEGPYSEDEMQYAPEPQNAQVQAGGTQDDAIELSD